MRKTIFLGAILSALILIGAGCEQNTNLQLDTGISGLSSPSQETGQQPDTFADTSAADNKIPSLEKPAPEPPQKQANTADGVSSPQELAPAPQETGIAKVKFVNKITGTPIPGHLIRCTGCTNGNVLETNLNGEITLEFTTAKPPYFSAHRIDWHNYNQVKDIKPGDTIVVETNPQAVNQSQRIFFPKATYTKNSAGKIQLNITYKDNTGSPKVNSPINLTGPIEGIGRKTAFGTTDAAGKATIELPINGAYRISIGTDFFQFEAPTGYDVSLTIDYSKLSEMTSGTQSLSKGFQERGMILVCVREKETSKPIFAIIMASTGELITRTVKYNDDTCTEVPKSYDKVGVLPTQTHKGLQYTSTASANNDGVLYLYVERN